MIKHGVKEQMSNPNPVNAPQSVLSCPTSMCIVGSSFFTPEYHVDKGGAAAGAF